MAPLLSRIADKLGMSFSSVVSSPGIKASGGTIIPSSTSGNGYTYHVFLYPNNDNFILSSSLTADILIVAGGGAGGAHFYAGAGGGGGVVYGPNIPLSAQTYTIQVGAGGEGKPGAGNPGTPSNFGGSVTALGGGGGGPSAAESGGSAGGSGQYSNTTTNKTPQPVPGLYIAYGNDSIERAGYGNGGGGAGTTNYAAPSPTRGGLGGDGIVMPQFPATIIAPAIPAPVRPRWNSPNGNGAVEYAGGTYYGAGGGGANYYTTSGVPVGGLGGGGNGGGPSTNPNPLGQFCNGYPGVHFTGSGGGGTNYNAGNRNPFNPTADGGAGGHGIVIIRYQ